MRAALQYFAHFMWETVKAAGRLVLAVLPCGCLMALLELRYGVAHGWLVAATCVYAAALVGVMHTRTRFGRWLQGGWL